MDDVGKDDNVANKGLDDGKTENNVANNEELEKKVSAQMEEFDRKMELGRNLNKIMNESGYNENGLDNDMMVALKTYELHGKNKEEEDIYKCT